MKKDEELLKAARTGNVGLVEKLLTASHSSTRTFAASFGIKVGPNVNCHDQTGYTPLHHAALNGHKAIVTLLLRNSTSVNTSDAKGSYPLHLAAWGGHHEIVDILLTHGPSIARVNEKNGDGDTALHCASQYGHTETVQVLLKNGADPSVRNVRDESPLDLASQYGRLDVVRLLLIHQPSLLKRHPDSFSPLHLASRNGHKEVVELLIAHGADVNRIGDNGSALHEAALFGKLEVVRLLLTRGANPHSLDPQNRSPLELVKQLNTQTSRDISQLILYRMQEGEDYEPISPVANSTLTSAGLRDFLRGSSTPDSPNTSRKFSAGFISGINQPQPTNLDKRVVPEVTIEDHYISPDGRRSTSANVSRSHTFKGLASGWSRSSFGKSGFSLRRSASARSSKSLPRLPSYRARSPSSASTSPDLTAKFRQHHPSSTMFPVSPTQSNKMQNTLSVLSLPAALPQESMPQFTRQPLKLEDNVFYPSPQSVKTKPVPKPRTSPNVTIQPLKDSSSSPTPEDRKLSTASQLSFTSQTGRPKKPTRSKRSTVSSVSSPPPIPPKPANMTSSSKDRPPSPDRPPPSDEDDEFGDYALDEDDASNISTDVNNVPHGETSAPRPRKTSRADMNLTCSILPSSARSISEALVVSGQISPVSPPSPNTAMLEVSTALQKAVIFDLPHHEEKIVYADSMSSVAEPMVTTTPLSEPITTSPCLTTNNITRPLPASQAVLSPTSINNLPTPVQNKEANNAKTVLRNSLAPHEELSDTTAMQTNLGHMTSQTSVPGYLTNTNHLSLSNSHVTPAIPTDSTSCNRSEKIKPPIPAKPRFKLQSIRKPNEHVKLQASSSPEASLQLDNEDGTALIDPDLTPRADRMNNFFGTQNTEIKSASSTSLHVVLDVSPNVNADDHLLSSQSVKSPGADDKTPTNDASQPQYDTPKFFHQAKKGPAAEDFNSVEALVADHSDCASDADTGTSEWYDELSDRSEDFEMPKECRKFRGLIRGSSYRFRSKSRYNNLTQYDGSSDQYGGESDEEYSLKKKMTRESSVDVLKKSSSRTTASSLRSDGGDSPMTSSAEESEQFPASSGLGSTVGADVLRSSFYDNNNNSNKTDKIAPLPDITAIKDTVAAVRSDIGSRSDSESSVPAALEKPSTPTGGSADEWAQIANVVSELSGGPNRNSVYAKEFQETFWKIMTGSDLPRQISTWLSELGIPQYETVLSGNGFDDVDFLADDVLEESDLIDMDITDASHRRRILESAKNLPKPSRIPPPDAPKAPSTVGEWLSSLHLPQYEAAFVTAGYHTVAHVRCMTKQQIKQIIPRRGHCKRIVTSLRPPSPQPPRKSSLSQTKSSPPLSRSPLLESVNFFKDYNNIVNSKIPPTTDPSSTVSSSSSSNPGSASSNPTGNKPVNSRRSSTNSPEVGRSRRHRSSSRVSRDHAIESERRASASSTKRSRSQRHQSPTSKSSPTRHVSELNVYIGNSVSTNNRRRASSTTEEKENRKMSLSSPPVANVPDAQRATYLASTSSDAGDGPGLNLRPPNEATSEVSVSAWRHPPEVLINSCCNYQAYYLGSMLIGELKGVQSTMEACSKMKRSTDSMKKIPTVTLSINYRGVKFIDFKSKHELAEHEIQNISFASQDADDLNTFAYITHDNKTGHHYCHVFRVTTMDMAYEIILTLGQAFEVAYQLILKDKALKENT